MLYYEVIVNGVGRHRYLRISLLCNFGLILFLQLIYFYFYSGDKLKISVFGMPILLYTVYASPCFFC